MNKFLLLAAAVMPMLAFAQGTDNTSVDPSVARKTYPGEVFDAAGNRVFYAEYGQHITSSDSPIYGRGRTYSEQILTHEASGKTFRLGKKRNEILSNGLVFMLYHFNDRHFEWIEAAKKMPVTTATHEHDSATTFYDVTWLSRDQPSCNYRKTGPEFWTVPEQGDAPILSDEQVCWRQDSATFGNSNGTIENFKFPEFSAAELKKNDFRLFRNEFGDPVFLVKGHLGADGNRTFGDWCDAVILHYYYEQNYRSAAFENIEQRRAEIAAAEYESNSYAEELLILSEKVETGATSIWGRPQAVTYFTMIDGNVVYLNKGQISAIKNKWLVLNENTVLRSNSGIVPRGGFFVEKKEVKARGIDNVNKGAVLEIRIKPEYVADFQAAMPQAKIDYQLALDQAEIERQLALDQAAAEERALEAAFAESNSYAIDMLALGRHYETEEIPMSEKLTTGANFIMLYFTEFDGKAVHLNETQVAQIKNKWLVLNEKTKRLWVPLDVPQAGFYVSSEDARARDIEGVTKRSYVLEIKAKPEFLKDFQAAMSAVVVPDTPARAAVQAKVDRLTVGILAGSFTRSGGDGYRTDANFKGPRDIAVDSHGNVYVVDGNSVRKITPDGRVSTFAGSRSGYVDGQGMTARFAAPAGIAIDGDDNLYIADSLNRRIRKIMPDGYVISLAGGSAGNEDGRGPKATFQLPTGIAVDAHGNVFVGDSEAMKIRKVSPDGTVTTVGDEAELKFSNPRSLAVDQTGNLYVLDDNMLKRVAPNGDILMMASNNTFEEAADLKNRALFRDAGSIAIDNDGNLLISRRDEHAVIRITPEGVTTTVARNNDLFWLGRPNALAIGGNGNIYLADDHNVLVHQITPAGNTGPLAGAYIPKPEPAAPQAVKDTLNPLYRGMSQLMGVPMPGPANTSRAAAAGDLGPAEAKALFSATKKNAKKDPEAMFALANMYADGVGVRRDPIRALSSYKKAAKSGVAGAQYELAMRHLDGTVTYAMMVMNGDVAAAQAKQLGKRQVNAAKLFVQSAAQGHALAQDALGQAYLYGHGVEQSSSMAIDWYSKAAVQGVFNAQLSLAEIYRNGNGTPVDLDKAIEWYAWAAQQGDAYSEAMKNGLLVQTDPHGAGRQISIDGPALADRAFALRGESAEDSDVIEAADLFHEAALLGDTKSQWMLGRMYLNGEGRALDPEQSLNWLTVAAELGDAEAQFQLGLGFTYSSGYEGSPNLDLAFHWYSLAAEQGLASAQFALGDIFIRGDGRRADRKLARDWFEKAAEQGDAHAQYSTGTLYLADTSDASHPARATEWFEKAAAQGHVYAAERLPAP
jgi:TPR repeat protein